MSELNKLFRQRIGIPETMPITFEMLDTILEHTAKSIPFENTSIMEKKTYEINRQNVLNKMLVKQEGGLCYELNSLFYFFLLENGFHAVLVRGDVYQPDTKQYLTIGRTHATILLTHAGQTYVVDTGFGGNLPLKPVPLTGETVISENGEFRVKKVTSELGDHVLEMKLKHKDSDWRNGYIFDSGRIADVAECNEIQEIIDTHPQSPFNKNRLLTKRTAGGTITLTDTTFTQWENGVMTKEAIDEGRFKVLLKEYFDM